ncbi:MAG: SgcJ/EcaC family oxidoreductase [Nitrososphaerales archaeon]
MDGTIAIECLYGASLDAWNKRYPKEYSALFTADADLIGFGGSQMKGKAEIECELRKIFASHQTATYVRKIQEIRFPATDVAVLTAIVGMVPPGKADIAPAVNSIQSLVAVKEGEVWHIALFQNTPAQFHGRPELSENLTRELPYILQRRKELRAI